MKEAPFETPRSRLAANTCRLTKETYCQNVDHQANLNNQIQANATAAATAAGIGVNKDDSDLAVDMDLVEKLMARALSLNPRFGGGAIHDFYIAWTGGRPVAAGGSLEKAEEHYQKALEIADGKRIGPHVSFAEVVCVKRQDKDCFLKHLRLATEFDTDTFPEYRLVNLVSKKRAQHLIKISDTLFF